MKYSIIIPVYNAKKYIKYCIESIYDSGLKNFEVILVNDGSTDDSEQECLQLSDKYSELKYVYQNNKGVSSARNTGIDYAKGEYILFCDADDTFEKNSLKDIDECLKEKPDLLILGLSMDFYFNNICYQQHLLIYPSEGIMEVHEWSLKLKKLFDYNVLSSSCNKIYRRDIIQSQNIRFDEDIFLYEDLVFSFKYLSCCNIIFFNSKLVYHYKQDENGRKIQMRINRLPSLEKYVKSIEIKLKEASSDLFINYGCAMANLDEIVYSIYYILLSQKLYYISFRQIREFAVEVLASDFCNKDIISLIDDNAAKLYNNLSRKRFLSIRIQNIYHQIRHRLALRYKYLRKRIQIKQ